ncbi:MAG: hypothetical protein WDO06_02170 [Actinomycetota bacterium]
MGSHIKRRAAALLLVGVFAFANTSAQAASWPPKGFHANGDVYAKIPTSKEIFVLLQKNKTLAEQSKTCVKYACGLVQVASRIGCTWWEILSTVSGPKSATNATRTPIGKLRVTYRATIPKKIATIYLRSREPLKPKITMTGITVSCYHSPTTELIPSTVYARIVKPKATPSPTPTPSESISTSPSASPSAT